MHNTYIEKKKSCSKLRQTFQQQFPNRPIPNQSTTLRMVERVNKTEFVNDDKTKYLDLVLNNSLAYGTRGSLLPGHKHAISSYPEQISSNHLHNLPPSNP